MEGYNCKHWDIQDWEIVCIGDVYYHFLEVSGHSRAEGELTEHDLDMLLDVYHYWKILLDCKKPRFVEMDILMHVLHFDVIIELFCQHKLGMRQKLRWIFD